MQTKPTSHMDFVSGSLANGRRLKCLTVADDFSHDAVQNEVRKMIETGQSCDGGV